MCVFMFVYIVYMYIQIGEVKYYVNKEVLIINCKMHVIGNRHIKPVMTGYHDMH